MVLLETVARIHEAEDTRGALDALAESLGPAAESAAWIGPDGTLDHSWPAGAQPKPAAVTAALKATGSG